MLLEVSVLVAVDSDPFSTFRRPLDAGATPAREAANRAEENIGRRAGDRYMSEMLREIVLRMVDVVVGRGPGRLYVCHGYILMKLLLSVRVRGRCGRLYLLRPFGEVGQLFAVRVESTTFPHALCCVQCSSRTCSMPFAAEVGSPTLLVPSLDS